MNYMSKKRMLTWCLSFSLVLTFLLPSLVKAEGSSSFAIVKGEFIPPAARIVNDDFEFTNSLELATNFHIFSQKAYLQAHTNGNIATALIDGPANFGTSIKSDPRAKLESEIHYIQAIRNIASSSFVSSSAKRGLKVYFGEQIQLSVVDNGNKLAANGIKLDHLKFAEAYQDAKDHPYIDFNLAFKELANISDDFHAKEATAGVLINDRDMNNRYIDISAVDLSSVYQQSIVTIVVTDDADQPLANANYNLYEVNGDDQELVASNISSDEEGLIHLELSSGNYSLSELTAPEGYIRESDSLDFTINSQSYDYIYVDVNASFLSRDHNPTPIKIKGLSENGPSVIFNVIMDKQDQSAITINSHIQPEIDGSYRNNRETEYFSDAKILWNFPNSVEKITINSPFQGSILATGAKVSNSANLDGNIIAKEVHIQGGESHRWDFQTRVTNPSSELKIRYKKPTVQEIPIPEDSETSTTEAIPSPTPQPTTESTTINETSSDVSTTTVSDSNEENTSHSESTENTSDDVSMSSSGSDNSSTDPSSDPNETESTEAGTVPPTPSPIPSSTSPSDDEEFGPSAGFTSNDDTSEDEAHTTDTPIFMVAGTSTYVGSSNPNATDADADTDADLITNPPLTGNLIPDWVLALLISIAATFVIGGIGVWIFERKLYKD